jgi:hypothetical protein
MNSLLCQKVCGAGLGMEEGSSVQGDLKLASTTVLEQVQFFTVSVDFMSF